MNDDPKKDLFTELTNTVKDHPVESIIAYKVLASKEQKKKVNEILASFGAAVILIVLVGCLVAPYFENLFIEDEKQKARGITTQDPKEIKDAKIVVVGFRIFLWFVALCAWAFTLWVLWKAFAHPYE